MAFRKEINLTILLVAFLFSSCTKEEKMFPKSTNFGGQWQVSASEKRVLSNGSGDETTIMSNFSIRFSVAKQDGEITRSITQEFLWATECGPDQLIISIDIDGSELELYRNDIFNIIDFNTRRVELRQEKANQEINGDFFNVSKVWILEK